MTLTSFLVLKFSECQKLINNYELPSLLLVYFMIGRMHMFRYVRRYSLPIFGLGICYYRYQDKDSSSFISQLATLFESLKLNEKNVYKRLLITITGDVIGITLCSSLLLQFQDFSTYNFSGIKKMCMDTIFNCVKLIPMVQNTIKKEKLKLESDLDKELKAKSRDISLGNMNKSLPSKGLSKDVILSLMKEATTKENVVWKTGKISGAVYHNDTSHQEFLNQAFGMYSKANPLHPDIWPSCMKFESEVIAMTAAMVQGNCNTVCGTISSGGTESIILAIKAHRDYYKEHYGIEFPEMIVSSSAHAAVDKACDLLKIKLIKVPMDPIYFKADVKAMESKIGPNTIMMYSSAPSYPQGVIDPISELGKLAKKYSLGLHVDCCLGGFFLPFAKKLGHVVPAFDFSIEGVTSMSLDTHKYGYALKGTSVVLYRFPELRHSQYFCYADWTGGLYTTPTIAGSRSGGSIAQTWASLMCLGEEGYLKHTKDILNTTKILAEGISKIKGLYLLGDAEAMIVCFNGEPGINIYNVAGFMSKRNWSLNSHQNPTCIHICVTVCNIGHEKELLKDLAECVELVRSDPKASHGTAAIYGMTSFLPNGPVNDILKAYNDVVLKV